MKQNISTIIFVIFINFLGFANDEQFKAKIGPNETTNMEVGASVQVEDLNYFSPNSYVIDAGIEIRLGIENDMVLPSPFAFKYTAVLEIETYNLTTNTITDTYNLTMDIEYSPFGSIGNLKDLMIQKLNGIQKINVNVISVTVEDLNTGNPLPNTNPGNVYLELNYKSNRQYTVTVQLPDITHKYITINSNNTESINYASGIGADELEIAWSSIEGADEYDLEWTWIDNYSNDSNNILLETGFIKLTDQDFRLNSTRIKTKDTLYRIPLIFANGYVVYRVRPLAEILYVNPENISKRESKVLYGKWTSNENIKTTLSNWPHKARTYSHELNKNWQFQASYAEDGKKKEVVSYFDGTLRNRQTVTKINSDNNAIVGEVIYDAQGRPAVEVLPVPSGESAIRYYDRFNLNTDPEETREIYSHLDFDWESDSLCYTILKGMHKESGSSKYYSDNNTMQNNWQDYVPDAKNYPFSQIEYTPDNTGRISRKGGVGETHKLGSGHEMTYYYGIPSQLELNRLFGYKVGYKKHYKKNTVVDPNGQASVSYIDPQGRTIATALAGENPLSLTGLLDENDTSLHNNIQEDLLNKLNIDDPDTGLDNNIKFSSGKYGALNDGLNYYSQFVVTGIDSDYFFDYKFRNNQTFTFCNTTYPFVYDLEISLEDACGMDVSNGGAYNDFVPSIFQRSFTTTLPQGSYNLNKTLTVNEQTLENYINSYLASGDCEFTPEDFRDNASFSGCFTTCEECVTSLGLKPDYITAGLDDKELENGGTLTSDQITAYTLILGNEYDTFLEACNKPCLEEELDFSCNINEQRLLQDFYPGEQYAVSVNTTEITNDDGAVIPFNPDGNNDTIVDDKLSIYKPDSKLPNFTVSDGSFVWQNPDPAMPYMDDFGNPAYVKVKVSIDENGNRVYSPEINELATGLNYDTAEPNEEGYILVLPNHLINHEDFEAEWKNSWAKSLLKYHPESCYLDYFAQLCSQQTTTNAGTLSATEYDSYLDGLDTYADAASEGLFGTETYIMDNDPFFNIDYSIESTTYFQKRVGIMAYALLGSYDGALNSLGEGLKLWEMAYIFVKCGNPELYTCTPPATLSLAIGEFNTEQKDAFWTRYRLFYQNIKQKITYVFSNLYAGQQGCLNECIDKNGNQPFQFVLSDYNDPVNQPSPDPAKNYYSFVVGQRSTFSSGYCSGSGASSYQSKERRFPPFDKFYNSSADKKTTAEDLVSDIDYTYWSKTGNCPLALDLQILLDGLFVDENTNLSTTMFDSTGKINAAYLTTDFYTALGGVVDPNPNVSEPSSAAKISAAIMSNNTIEISITDSNDTDSNLENGETCPIILSNSTYNFNFYGSSWKIIKMDHVYYVPDSYDNITKTFDFSILATVELSSGVTTEVVFNGTTCAAIGECGVGPGHIGQDLNPDVDPALADSETCSDLGEFKYAMLDLLNFLRQTTENFNGSIDFLSGFIVDDPTDAPFDITNGVHGNNQILTTGYANDFLINFFGLDLTDILTWEFDGVDTYTLRRNEIPIFRLNNIINLSTINPALFTELTFNQDTEGNQYYGTLKYITSLDSTEALSIVHSQSYIHGGLNCCLKGAATNFSLSFAIVHKDPVSSNRKVSFITFTPKTTGYRLGEDLEFDYNIDINQFVDGFNGSVSDSDVRSASVTIKSSDGIETFSLADNTLWVEYTYETRGGGDRSLMNFDFLRGRSSAGNVWDPQYHADFELDYLKYTINGNSVNMPIQSATNGVPIVDTENLNNTILMSPNNNNWIQSLTGSDFSRVLMDDSNGGYYTNWKDGFMYNFENGVNLSLQTKLKVSSLPTIFVGYGSFGHILSFASSTNNKPSNQDDLIYITYLYQAQAESVTEPGCADCIVQTVEPVSCDEKYATFVAAINGGLIEGYTLPNFYTKEFFCQMNYQYSVDDYLYYVNHPDFATHPDIDPKSVDNINFMTIGEFATSALNQGYIGMQSVIDNFVAYQINREGLKDSDTWGAYVEKYVNSNNVGCLPKSLFTETLEIGSQDIVYPCMEFDMNIKDTYQADLYDQYIEIKKAEFREAYLEQALNNAVENFDTTRPDKEYQYTLYYYDQAGNLAQTVSPEGVYRLGDNPADGSLIDIVREVNISRDTNPDNQNHLDPSGNVRILPDHKLKTQYKYNSLNQLVWQKTPDGGETRFAYDALGRIIASQNAKQLDNNNGTMSYTRYDVLGRIIEAGEMVLTSDYTIDDSGILILNSTGLPVVEVNDVDIVNGLMNFPGNITIIPRTQVTRTYYDKMILDKKSLFKNYDLQSNRNRVTAILYYNQYDSSTPLELFNNGIYYNYDIHGNVDEMVTEINDPKLKALEQHIKKVHYSYDLVSGNVNRVTYQKGKRDQFIHRYEYDDDNRITSVYTSNDDILWEKDANYQYYAHGPLARVLIGDKEVQGVDYAYTLQGWLKGVNNEVLNLSDMAGDASLNNVAKDAFAYTLSYFNDDYTARLATNPFNTSDTFYNTHSELMNGNIRGMTTALTDTDENPINIAFNKYTYDQLNRITGMNSNEVAYTGGVPNIPGAQSSYSYDRNGNLKTLYRSASDPGNSIKAMDSLSYTYYTDGNGDPTNKLKIVNDTILGTEFSDIDIDNHTNDYIYDEIGQLTKDLDEGIQNIHWRVDGKVDKVEKTDGQEISFTYDGLGNRLSKYNKQENKTTYYMRDAQGNVLGVYNLLDTGNGSVPPLLDYNIILNNQVFTTTETYQATHNIEAISGVSVEAGGDLTLEAGNAVILQPGFTVKPGGDFVAKINAANYPSYLTFKLSEHQIYGSSRLGLQNYEDIELSGPSDVAEPYKSLITNQGLPVNNQKPLAEPSPNIEILPLPIFAPTAKALVFDSTNNLVGTWTDTSNVTNGAFGIYSANIDTKINILTPPSGGSPTSIGTVSQLSFYNNYYNNNLGVKSILLNIESDGTNYAPIVIVEDRYLYKENNTNIERVYKRTTKFSIPLSQGITDPALRITFKAKANGYNSYSGILVVNGISYTLANQSLNLSVSAVNTQEPHVISDSRIPGSNTAGMAFEMCNFSYALNNNQQSLDFSNIGVNPTIIDLNPSTINGETVSTEYIMNLSSLDTLHWIDSYCDNTIIIIDRDGDGVIDNIDIDDDNDGILDIVEGANDIDNDGIPNYFDLDSDNDGILDNVEVRTTLSYIAPSGIDSDGNGLDDAYETTPGNGNGINPINTDGDGAKDFMDLDSDNDGVLDAVERNSSNLGIADSVASGVDTDQDGLDDAFEGANIDDAYAYEVINPATAYRNTDGEDDLDYRDIDDDNDGYVTYEEDANLNTILADDDSDTDGLSDYLDPNNNSPSIPEVGPIEIFSRIAGDKHYELSNHLGNVLAVISDRKLVKNGIFTPDVLTYNDYFPFGSLLPNRHGSSDSYRYAFNGKEKDDEIKGEGNSYDYEARMFDPRVGRWLSVDPQRKRSPGITPYRFGFNNPIRYFDPNGQWEEDGHFWTVYAFGIMAGLDNATALIIAKGAENYDHKVHDDFSLSITPYPGILGVFTWGADGGLGTWAHEDLQGPYHALTGKSQAETHFDAWAQIIFGKNNDAFHTLGDAWSHSYIDKSTGRRMMFGAIKENHWLLGEITKQHAFMDENGNERDPETDTTDNIADRPDAYKGYIKSLDNIFNDPRFEHNNQVTNKTNFQLFDYVQKNGGSKEGNILLFETYIAYKNGQRNFVAFNESNYKKLKGLFKMLNAKFSTKTEDTGRFYKIELQENIKN